MRLRELSAPAYAQAVLPLTQPLWGRGRSLEAYAEQTLEISQSPYGRKSYRTFALSGDGDTALASFKRYERAAVLDKEHLRALGIGAVFTPEAFRGRGYASAMIGMALDESRRGGFDFAYLFSDIHPKFYRDLGFVELPSRSISLRADALSTTRLTADPIRASDWSAIRRCFDATQNRRTWGLTRSPLVWDWIRLRMRQSAEHASGQPVNLVLRAGRGIAAYVFGQREPRHDAYVVDEFGYSDGADKSVVPALLRVAAEDLRRIAGWLPPAGAREALPRGSVRRRTSPVWMIAPLSPAGGRFVKRAASSGSSDGIWSLDHI